MRLHRRKNIDMCNANDTKFLEYDLDLYEAVALKGYHHHGDQIILE